MRELTPKRILLTFAAVTGAMAIALTVSVASGGLLLEEAAYALAAAAVSAGVVLFLVKYARSIGRKNGRSKGG